MSVLLEACVDSLAAAVAAEAAGADRLELCSGLELGGLSPGAGLLAQVLARVRIPVCPLLRPRAGDFLYEDHEMAVLLAEIEHARAAGAHGVVIGMLQADGRVDAGQLRACVAAAGKMEVVFHRAFDRCADRREALEVLVEAGVKRVLTSGGAENALAGASSLAALVAQANGRIAILAGGGVSPVNAQAILKATGAKELHFSAIRKVDSAMRWLDGVARLGSLDDATKPQHYIPDPEKVAAIRALVD